MNLTQDEKDELKALTEHRGFKILERLAEEMKNDLYSIYDTEDIGDPDTLKDINNAKLMLIWARKIISTAKGRSQSAVIKVVK